MRRKVTLLSQARTLMQHKPLNNVQAELTAQEPRAQKLTAQLALTLWVVVPPSMKISAPWLVSLMMLELHALLGNIAPRLAHPLLSNAIQVLSAPQRLTRIKTIALIVQQANGVQRAHQLHHLNVPMALTVPQERFLMMSSAVLQEKHPQDP